MLFVFGDVCFLAAAFLRLSRLPPDSFKRLMLFSLVLENTIKDFYIFCTLFSILVKVNNKELSLVFKMTSNSLNHKHTFVFLLLRNFHLTDKARLSNAIRFWMKIRLFFAELTKNFLSKACLVAIRCCLHVAMACHYFSARWLDHNLVQNDIY